jgi:transketolase
MSTITPEFNKELQAVARDVRKKILRMIVSAHASHIASSYSIVELLVYLYEKVLRVTPAWESDRDRFILSKGWAAAALFVVLSKRGFFKEELLDTYCVDGGSLIGAVTKYVPGVEATTCSMGHGLPIGVGMALAARHRKEQHRIFVLMSDGECDEGSVWEAALQAGHHKLDNLILIIDYNKLQSFGRVEDILNLEPLASKWESFGWTTRKINGHDFYEIAEAFSDFSPGKPMVIIANTIKGKGVSVFENKNEWHYKTPTSVEIAIAEKEL